MTTKQFKTYDEIRKKVLDAYYIQNISLSSALAIYCKDIKMALKISESIKSVQYDT